MRVVDMTLNRNGQLAIGDIEIVPNSWSPTAISPNEPFNVTYQVHNKSTTSPWIVWGLIEYDNGMQVPNSSWESLSPLQPNAILNSPIPAGTYMFPSGISAQTNLNLIIGHLESETPIAVCNGAYAGSPNIPVPFIGLATGGTAPHTFMWTFGDGETSFVQNPTHTYIAVGVYTVTLTVTDSASLTNSCSTTATITEGGQQPFPIDWKWVALGAGVIGGVTLLALLGRGREERRYYYRRKK